MVTLYVLDDGKLVSLILDAPEFVNRPFRELFPHGLPPGTTLIAGSKGPQRASEGTTDTAGN